MRKKLFRSRSEARTTPDVSEPATKLHKIIYQHGRIEGATQCTADESGRGLRRYVDGLIHRRDFCDRNSLVNCF